MFEKLLTSAAFLSVGLFNLAAAAPTGVSPALAIPTSGKYRIQSAVTGFFIDDLNSNQADGAPVVVAPLNNPPTANQEWTLDINSGHFGTLQSTSSFIRILSGPTGQLVTELGTKESAFFTFMEASGGVLVCADPVSFGCLTSPTEPNATITLTPLTSAQNQVWIFEIVG
ncbi:hypothetical protein QCA50_004473 [Cerrena zonata]|uniref:Ricin B lectin domain-containing protein n=1 Tax=Cerrena zonata TaxID=2478898 RepID=A0AAW0GRJ9_9APHY